jgi:hypothetical protein
MKMTVIVAAMLVGSFAMAEGAATTAPATQAAPAAQAATGKMSKKEARAACKKEDAKLKGKALVDCVKSKTM